MTEQKSGQITDEKSLMKVDDQSVKKLQKGGDSSWDEFSSLDSDSSVNEFDIHRNEGFSIIPKRSDDDDDDDHDAISELPSMRATAQGPVFEDTFETDRLEYFSTSPFDVLYEDESVPRVASNNDSGGGYGGTGVSTSNDIEEMLILMASLDHFVPADVSVANNASDGEATTGQSLEQERDRVSVGDSENSIDGEKGGEGFLLGWWQKCLLLLGLWKLV